MTVADLISTLQQAYPENAADHVVYVNGQQCWGVLPNYGYSTCELYSEDHTDVAGPDNVATPPPS